MAKVISYRLQFIGSARFMASLLSNLVNYLTERIHKINPLTDIIFRHLFLVWQDLEKKKKIFSRTTYEEIYYSLETPRYSDTTSFYKILTSK